MKRIIIIMCLAAAVFATSNQMAAQDKSEDAIQYALVDEKPMFQGKGPNEFTKWAFMEMVYPKEARDKYITGRVTLEFVITKEGKVTDVKVLRSAHPLLDAEAVRVVSKSPDWTPGKVKGEPVNVKYVFPLIFDLRGFPKAAEDSLKEDKPAALFAVDVKPKFQGKDAGAFSKWVLENLKYPSEAKEKKLGGRVIMLMVVGADGKVKDIRVIQSSGYNFFDAEAMRVLSTCPDWEPGMKDGKPVDVRYVYPVVFKAD